MEGESMLLTCRSSGGQSRGVGYSDSGSRPSSTLLPRDRGQVTSSLILNFLLGQRGMTIAPTKHRFSVNFHTSVRKAHDAWDTQIKFV